MSQHTHSFLFVVGGVMSGVGKGISSASLGTLLQAHGYSISNIKADPYLNVDAGTMNPTEHGEVFVMDSGLETDQDMGNYERFLNKSLPPENYMTNGMVFKHVIDKERALEYEGKCVEPTFHITEEIIRRLKESVAINKPDITIVEIGGTIGEYQNAIFIEAIRTLQLANPESVKVAMVTYAPVPPTIGEMKTKPTQNAVRQLNGYGVSPDILIVRAETDIDPKRREKIAQMCGVRAESVFGAPDVSSIYDIPLSFHEHGMSERILELFGLPVTPIDLSVWGSFTNNFHNPKQTVSIAIAGKYFDTGDFMLSDSYISIIEALKISGAHQNTKVALSWIDTKNFEDDPARLNELDAYDGVLIPGGFGSSGIEGKIKVIEYVRTNKIPFFGICYGMQLAVVEYARNQANMTGAHTTEVDPQTKFPVVDILPEQRALLEAGDYGGSMRLGSYTAHVVRDTHAYVAYQSDIIDERHRHRYEVNPMFINELEKNGLVFAAASIDSGLKEIIELPTKIHPFFVATQFHPEFKARPADPHPLFSAFITAASQ